jgi:hypothetical protein
MKHGISVDAKLGLRRRKKKKWQIDSKRSFEYPHKHVIGIQKKGKVKVLQQTYRTATRTQRDGAH